MTRMRLARVTQATVIALFVAATPVIVTGAAKAAPPKARAAAAGVQPAPRAGVLAVATLGESAATPARVHVSYPPRRHTDEGAPAGEMVPVNFENGTDLIGLAGTHTGLVMTGPAAGPASSIAR